MGRISRLGLATTTAVLLLGRLLFASEPDAAVQPLAFPDLWQAIDRHSPSQRAVEREIDAAHAAETRSGRYREPQVYATGRVFNTNDPTLIFMSHLSQREIATSDFTPSRLNEPSAATLSMGTLGVAMPLYEGGQGSARTEAAKLAAEAAEHERASLRVQQYAAAFEAYGTILAHLKEAAEVRRIAAEVNDIASHYEVGSASNPVGYSGLLALQGMSNRMRILTSAFEAQAGVPQATLSAWADLAPSQWQVETASLDDFVARYAALPPGVSGAVTAATAGSPASESARTRAMRARALSTLQQAQIERSVLLPKVGLFAEGNALVGDRGTGTSYLAGAYVTWALSAPTARGAEAEAILQSGALQEQANASALEDRASVEEGRRMAEMARNTLTLLHKSAELLDEQLRISKRLFSNGTIGASQLVELYGRRLDAVQSSLQYELTYLQANRLMLQHQAQEVHGS